MSLTLNNRAGLIIQRIALCAGMLVSLFATPVTGTVLEASSRCPESMQKFIEYRLFFGRNSGDAEVVTDEAWSQFLAQEITSRFPDGLTVVDAHGQWRDPSGAIVRERTKMLVILAEPNTESLKLTEEVAEHFKRTFNQDSVLRVSQVVCAAF